MVEHTSQTFATEGGGASYSEGDKGEEDGRLEIHRVEEREWTR